MTEPQKAPDPRAANLAKARAQRAANRAARLAQAQMPIDEGVAAARTPVRSNQVVGRNGEVLSRSPISMVDTFEVPKSMIPAGWEYQWNHFTVINSPDVVREQAHAMYLQGWRPVPAERHAGILIPANSRGDIIRGGLRLDERPKSMCEDARAEDVRNARQQISDRNEALKLAGVRKNMPDGFEMGQKYRGTGGDIRLSIDKALDVPAPTHKLAEPGE